jgi:Zn finger protein HypA/HybF involved in hydrogenase expression
MARMALIQCEECGKEISDLALACPQCGFAHAAVQHHRHQQAQTAMKADQIALIVVAFIIAGIAFAYITSIT